MPETSNPALQPLVERFVKAFDDFLADLDEAVAAASANPAAAGSEQLQVWTLKAVPVLKRYQAAIHAAAADFEHGDTAPILKQGSLQSSLAKNLDGYPLGFAGPDYEKKLDELETLVVVTADRLCRTAGSS